jgi:hypothetical protein
VLCLQGANRSSDLPVYLHLHFIRVLVHAKEYKHFSAI